MFRSLIAVAKMERVDAVKGSRLWRPDSCQPLKKQLLRAEKRKAEIKGGRVGEVRDAEGRAETIDKLEAGVQQEGQRRPHENESTPTRNVRFDNRRRRKEYESIRS